jgi:hypothetical protein
VRLIRRESPLQPVEKNWYYYPTKESNVVFIRENIKV